ncbi:siphovirus ReqiPepy6 Gp37-like family protein [Streptomyces exfoliatus]|uniref:siphovirus ReqiPepy6 Gp37-like family protein n=1 Tax=Streptomyces exfoliatus TaxID=1905 RepID=UPI0037BA8060
MKQADLLVEVRDASLTRLGTIPADLLTLEAEDVHNNVGTWKLQLNAEHPLAAVLSTPGAGIIVTGPTDVLFSGPVTMTDTAITATDPLGTLTVEGVDDTIILSDMLAWPDPASGDPSTQTLPYDERTGRAETLMHTYVDVNCGPGAPANRRRAGLVMGANGARGATVTKSARFQQLGELCKELAEPNGLGFRVVQRGNQLVFETYAVADRTKEARLGVVNNTLAGQRVSVSTPQKTRVIVGGDGDGTNRLFVGVDNADSLAAESAWGRRIESFVDERSSTDVAELTQKGTEALADGGATVKAAQAVPMEDSALDFGRDWFLGDRVSVLVGGTEMAAVVTSMVLKVDGDGYRLGATLGDPTPLSPQAASTAAQRGLESRLSSLERTAEAPPAGARAVSSVNFTQASLPDSYPPGESRLVVDSAAATAGGWDFAPMWGSVETVRTSSGYTTQRWARIGGAPDAHQDWHRHGSPTTGWAPWRKLAFADEVNRVPRGVLVVQAPLTQTPYIGDTETVVYTQQFTAEAGRCYRVILRVAVVDTDGTGDSTTLRYPKQGAETRVRWAVGATVTTSAFLAGNAYTTTFDDDSATGTGLNLTCYINNPPAGLVTVGVTIGTRRPAATYGMVRLLPSTGMLAVEDAGAAF